MNKTFFFVTNHFIPLISQTFKLQMKSFFRRENFHQENDWPEENGFCKMMNENLIRRHEWMADECQGHQKNLLSAIFVGLFFWNELFKIFCSNDFSLLHLYLIFGKFRSLTFIT